MLSTAGTGLLLWSSIFALERFDVWQGDELSYVAVGSMVAGNTNTTKIEIIIHHLFIIAFSPLQSGAVILFLGLLGLVTSCSSSYSWSYCYSLIILVFIIIQSLLAVFVILFR